MRPAWRLATSAFSSRRKRSALLIAAVALSALLVSAVATATHSINASLEARIVATVGNADARLEPSSGSGSLPVGLLDDARSWEGVGLAIGRMRESIAIEAVSEEFGRTWSTALGLGIDPENEDLVRPIELSAGRLPQGPDEVVLDELLAARLAGLDPAAGMMAGRAGQVRGVDGKVAPTGPAQVELADVRSRSLGVGDTVRVRRLLARSEDIRVVGIAKQPPLGGRPRGYFTLGGLAVATGKPAVPGEIDLVLTEGVDPEAFVERERAGVAERYDNRVLIQTSTRITSGLEQNLRSSRVGFYVGSVMAFLSAGFIIMTGLTVDVAQRQRELAIVRCIGGTRRHLALSQLIVGGIIGGVGAVIGLPGGVLVTWALVEMFKEHLGAGLAVSGTGLTLAGVGSVMAGLIGAAWPAWKAASTSPLRALSPHAVPAKARGIALVLACGLGGALVQLATISLPSGDAVFWSYLTVGLPALVIGYFLLGVPTVVVITRLLGPMLDKVLGLPRGVLQQTIGANPYRYGFTTGAMMGGLALMLSIWAQGGSVMRDWLGSLRFPDAFVYGLSLSPEIQERLATFDFVEGTAAISVHPIETDAFGVRGLTNYRSSFIAFEPDAFFELATLRWVEGDEETAKRRLNEGGAIIVAREFMVAQGLGVGDTFTCRNAVGEDRSDQSFEIVGVVTSPGLDIVSTFFNIGEGYTEQALHAVFGSRRDLRERFGSDAVQLVQIELAEDVDDTVALDAIKAELFDAGILDAGSGREIKRELAAVITNTLIVSTTIAIGAMVIASFGVANLIVASVETRRYELGVFRAIGAGRASLARLVVGESIVVALAACLLGFVLSLQGTLAGRVINRTLLGLDLQPYVPWVAVGIGFTTVIGVCVFAALPAALGVLRARPRELLQQMGA